MPTLGKNGKPMLNVYVVWSLDGPIMTTLLQYEDDAMERQAMQQWSTYHYVSQAYDAEFNESMPITASYEVAAIFTADKLNFIY